MKPHATRSEPADYRPLGPAHAVMAGLALLSVAFVVAVLVYAAFVLLLAMGPRP